MNPVPYLLGPGQLTQARGLAPAPHYLRIRHAATRAHRRSALSEPRAQKHSGSCGR